ncbi:MAG: gamma carbonic anhydrase family protein [Actinomycetales bacterium]|nr:gamma carbonic anhydrase family protein [Actinomycetales bacterium]
MGEPGGKQRSLDDLIPEVLGDAWVAPSAELVGAVRVGRGASIWYGSVLRADGDRVVVGEDSNIQDNCVLHADPGLPVLIGDRVSVGHRAVLHGCVVEDEVLVGMGAIVLNGARIGAGSLIAAGTVELEGADIPPGSLVAGVPGKVRRTVRSAERAETVENARTYLDLAARHASAVTA